MEWEIDPSNSSGTVFSHMKIIRYSDPSGQIHSGIEQADGRVTRLDGDVFGPRKDTGETAEVARLLAPVVPTQILCIGLNYGHHANESGMAVPERPILFVKGINTLQDPGEPILIPTHLRSDEVDYECELAVVIGKPCKNVSRDEALDYVLGYTCANDVSERVIQKEEMDQGCLLIGKGFDTFCPLGPVIATGLDPSDLKLEARLNGETRQSSSTSDLLFTVPQLVSYLSQAISLQPGDVIITGTPSGVGEIAPGDVMEIALEGVGVLRNSVVAETRTDAR